MVGGSHVGWYVDDRCTNCDVARQLSPELIGEVDGRSKILRQPRNEAEIDTVYAAAYACYPIDPAPIRATRFHP